MTEIIKIQKKEWVFVSLITLGILLLTTLPYIYGFVSVPDGKTFMGLTYNVDDHAQYFSWYKAFQSDFLISNRQTSESNPKIFFNLLWWILAQFGKITGLSFVAVYQIFRWFFRNYVPFSCLRIYIAGFFKDKKKGVWHF